MKWKNLSRGVGLVFIRLCKGVVLVIIGLHAIDKGIHAFDDL